nr:bifunctional diguanylate cyclase/phosphodiesterase [Chloroflexota bacterium]
ALVLLAGDPAVAELLAQRTPAARDDASATLRTLSASSDGVITTASVMNTSGTVHLRLWDGRTAAAPGELDNGRLDSGRLSIGRLSIGRTDRRLLREALAVPDSGIHRSAPYAVAPGDYHLTLATTLPANREGSGGDGDGIVRLEISLASLATAAGALLPAGASSVELLDTGDGAVLAEAHRSEPADRLSEAVAGVTGSESIGQTFSLPGFGGWEMRVSEHDVPATVPRELLAVLGLLTLFVVGGTYWMSRQIVKPAEELERSRAELDELYYHARQASLLDALTGLGNHRAFQEEFDRQLDQATRYGAELSLLLIDLDDFKLVNDSAGHAVGDELLSELGRLIHATIRRSDRAFRIGGDEFAMLMPHTGAEAAYVLARRLLAMTLQPRTDSRFGRPFSFSAGISACPALGTKRSQLYAQADAALYSCKRHGRTAIEIFDPANSKIALDPAEATELSAKVASVAARRALKPVYQPIVDLSTGRILGYEGLVRPAADSGFADAGRLFEAAEGSGRTIELDQACLEAVAMGAAEMAPDQLLSINVSPRTLEAPEFSATVLLKTLATLGITPGRLVLELTERENVENLDRLRRNLAACQAAGVRIAADDVGAGNAGLRLLSQIHFDIVKIDLSLVQGGAMRDSSLAVVGSLRDLASRWGAMVIAEGVETSHQLGVLRALGITAAQGYLLGRPSERIDLGPVDLEAMMVRNDWLASVKLATPLGSSSSA